MSNIKELFTEDFDKDISESFEERFEESFCGCNSYTGEKCGTHSGTHTTSIEKYEDSYTGKFPMAFGTRGDHVEALQRHLVSKLALVMGNTPYGYFGDATKRGLVSLGLPIVINNETELNKILGTDTTPAPGTSTGGYSSNWKQFGKDPNQVFAGLGKLKELTARKPKDPNAGADTTNSLPAGLLGADATPAPPATPIPPVVYIVGGLVLLVVLIFVFMQMLKD